METELNASSFLSLIENNIKKTFIYLFLAAPLCYYDGLCLVEEIRGYCLVVVCGLLSASVASLVEHRPMIHRLRSCSSQALKHKLSARVLQA